MDVNISGLPSPVAVDAIRTPWRNAIQAENIHHHELVIDQIPASALWQCAMSPLAAIRIKRFRLSQTEFARRLCVHQTTVSGWETGKRHPRPAEQRKIRDLAQQLGIRWQDKWFFEEAA